MMFDDYSQKGWEKNEKGIITCDAEPSGLAEVEIFARKGLKVHKNRAVAGLEKLRGHIDFKQLVF